MRAGVRSSERRRVRGKSGGTGGAGPPRSGRCLLEGRRELPRGGLHRLVHHLHDQPIVPWRISPGLDSRWRACLPANFTLELVRTYMPTCNSLLFLLSLRC